MTRRVGGDAHGDDNRFDARPHDVGGQHEDDRARDIVNQVVDLGEQEVELADVTPEQAGQDAGDRFDRRYDDADEE